MTPLVPRRYKTVPGRSYGTPKELWGFRTAAVRGTPRAIARRFLRDSAELLGIQSVRSRLRLARVIESVGAVHVIFQQGFRGRRIHRSRRCGIAGARPGGNGRRRDCQRQHD